ncbi:stress response protein rds1p protein [Diplodia corticola]|uniref:Stress response protein rds1p protein n=1 Tax=Diplodia corticola TaxID=236234 RepID=A0A1J9R1K0_9PEZI|nr:stress response protein rds1p protein [Diplodia corticola]OJD35270.1 stress response protein rds1p protein [Diplodia corticola]
MAFIASLIIALSVSTAVWGIPTPDTQRLSNLKHGSIPGESDMYTNYTGKAAPFPGNLTAPIKATSTGPAGPDDVLFQNLLGAEWAIYSFYQQGVETFSFEDFTNLGLPETTYERLVQIRDNEAGHLRIFQDQISANSVKPGACKYEYGFTGAESYLALQVLLEVSSMAFLTGLVQEAQTNATKGALVAIAEVESRHNTWALIDVWGANPFAGPSDTVYPYANQILDITRVFIVPGSCPSGNPVYPSPHQNLPPLSFNMTTSTAQPGSKIDFVFSDETNVPDFKDDKDYYAVFFHGVNNISVPLDTKTNSSVVPAAFDAANGIIIGVLADVEGAPTLESVVAGPVFLLEQPQALTQQV